MTKVFCDNRDCFYYGTAQCVAKEIWHTSDGFCTAYRRKAEVEYKEMMRNNKPLDFKRCEKLVSN